MIVIGKNDGSADVPRWRVAPCSHEQARRLARDLGLSVTTASVLVRRGLGDADSARRFLEASDSHDPWEFHGMSETVELILQHVRRGSVIAVHGDYDVDGVCSTAVAVRALRALGATVQPRLPSRTEDGYGLSMRNVEDLHARGARLLVTADCGIGDHEQVARAQQLGLDVVVTDHHRPDAELPDCPVIHPGVCDYPFPDLCATGVVYKLSQALHEAAGKDPAALEQELDLVALATVADVVPLLGENRALVRAGLRVLAGTARPGLRALLRVARVQPQAVSEHTLGFVLGPRINAAGRLYRADAALELLLTEDAQRAEEVARELDAINTERRAVETRILFEAERKLSAAVDRREAALHVLAGEGWHPGVIGVVASRLVERHHRPCVLVALDGDGYGRGSGRSIAAYDLHAGLTACRDHLERFGGHRMAAGLELRADSVEPLRRALERHARSALRPEDLVPVERVDAVIGGDAVGLDLAEEIAALRPFGIGNPGVNLLLPAARLSSLRPMGEGRHARLTVISAGVRSRAVAFGVGDELSRAAGSGGKGSERRHDVIARLETNEWRGAVEPRLVLRALHRVKTAGERGQDAEEGCARCECRARGEDWCEAVLAAVDEEPDSARATGGGHARVVVDRRGRGIIGTLGALLSSGESVVVACADVSRRRALLEHELGPERFGRSAAVVLSARCAPRLAQEHVAAAHRSGVWLVDYATINRRADLLESFTHVFALDPPPFEHLRDRLEQSAPAGAKAFVHLGWGPAELEFASRVLEQEYALRPAVADVYRALAQQPEGLAGPPLEAALTGERRHPRSPEVVGRALRVLCELGLAGLERSSGTLECTISSKRRVDLERSETFLDCARLLQEGLQFLSETTERKAA